MQIVSMPHNLLITDYVLGHTGSVHDSRSFHTTHTYREHNQIFGSGEFLFADSAYPAKEWSVPPFKKPKGGELTANE